MRSIGVYNGRLCATKCKKRMDVKMSKVKTLEVLGKLDLGVLGKELHYYNSIEDPMFLAKDIADWIEHSDVSMMLKIIDEDEKLRQALFVSGQIRNSWFLTEDGMYEVLFNSRKQIAKTLKKDIKNALKEIRQNGMYVSEEATPEQKTYNYELLDVAFSRVGAEFFLAEYMACISYHERNKTRLPYERRNKNRRADKKQTVAESKIKIMEKVLKIAEEREYQYRVKFQWELKSLISSVVSEIMLDIKTIRHNQTRGKLAQSNKVG
jgi:hypothetical protein